MDAMSRKIMIALSKDGRYSYARLAEELGVKATTVARRVETMLEDDVFFISAVPNPVNMGYKVMAVITLDVTLSEVDNVCARLVDNPYVRSIATTFGRFDVILFVECRELEILQKLVREEISNIEGVRSVEPLFVSEVKKSYQGSSGLNSRSNKPITIDDIDEKIIEGLRKNGRATFNALADQLGVSPATVSRRVDSLINNNIIKITIVPNPIKLGHSVAAYIGLKVELNKIDEICSLLAKYDQVPSVMTLMNGYDILAVISTPDLEALYKFIIKEISRIKGVINEETLIRADFKKRTYLGFDIEQRLRQLH